jgi:hypothetical protein
MLQQSLRSATQLHAGFKVCVGGDGSSPIVNGLGYDPLNVKGTASSYQKATNSTYSSERHCLCNEPFGQSQYCGLKSITGPHSLPQITAPASFM